MDNLHLSESKKVVSPQMDIILYKNSRSLPWLNRQAFESIKDWYC